jgi:hypothetical protein
MKTTTWRWAAVDRSNNISTESNNTGTNVDECPARQRQGTPNFVRRIFYDLFICSSHDQLPLNNSNNLPNVKSEIGASHHHQQRRQQMAERMQMQSQQQSQRQSFEDLDENMNNQKSIKVTTPTSQFL